MATQTKHSVSTCLSDRALLVSLRIRQWTARRLDKQETIELARRHGMADNIARVNKRLLPNAPLLDELATCSASLRTFYYASTLPWAVDGSQIIPAEHYMTFAQETRDRLAAWHRLKDLFLREYPTYRANAAQALNGLFKADDYPEPARIETRFEADVRFFPMPDARDFRVALADEEMARISQDLEATAKQALAESTRECWSRLHTVVSRAAERLSDPKAIFRDSLTENAKELCGLLTALNLGDDPDLEAMRQQVERTLAAQNPEVLRADPRLRQDVAEQLSAMERKMRAFMG